jgi:alpha-glucosidase
MRKAGIPLEGMLPSSASTPLSLSAKTASVVMWNDIDLYHAVRDFTTDPVSFPADEVKAFIANLVRASIILYTDTMLMP